MPDLIDTVKSLRPVEADVHIRSPKRESDYHFKGCTLWDYARHHGMLPAEKQQGSFSNLYFVATAEDGMTVAVSFCEVSPGFSSRQVLLAYEQDGEPIRAGLRLVVPGDYLGGRSIYGVASIEARTVPYERLPQQRGSSGIELSGQLDRPATLGLDALRAMRHTTVTLTRNSRRRTGAPVERSFSGPTIYRLLEQAGIQLDEAIHEHFLRKIVVARGSEGFAVVIAGGEIEPRFLASPVIAATEGPGGPLGEEEGNLRLVVPHDIAVARDIKGLVGLELRDA